MTGGSLQCMRGVGDREKERLGANPKRQHPSYYQPPALFSFLQHRASPAFCECIGATPFLSPPGLSPASPKAGIRNNYPARIVPGRLPDKHACPLSSSRRRPLPCSLLTSTLFPPTNATRCPPDSQPSQVKDPQQTFRSCPPPPPTPSPP